MALHSFPPTALHKTQHPPKGLGAPSGGPDAAGAGLGSRPPRQPKHSPALVSGLQAFAAEELGMGALLRFRSFMAQQGHSVQLARMCFDKLYAYERIASAHATESEPLRRLALELFQAYHRRDEMRQALAS